MSVSVDKLVTGTAKVLRLRGSRNVVILPPCTALCILPVRIGQPGDKSCMALQLQRVGGMEPCRSHGALDDDRTGTRLRGHLGLCAARLSEIEADLPPAGKLDIDLCKKLGVKQSAMFDAVRTIRSEERRVGKEGVRTCRFRWGP